MSEGSFGGIIFPGYAIVFEESKQTFTVLDETLLVFESKFRMVMVVENDLCIEESYLVLKVVQVSLFQTILLDCLHNCSELSTPAALLENISRFLLTIAENIPSSLLGLDENALTML